MQVAVALIIRQRTFGNYCQESIVATIDICEKSFGAIIQVLSTNSGGTGFFVGENLIFTNSHVVKSLNDIRIKDHSKNEWQAKAIYRDPKMDICILESEVPCGTSLSLLTDEDQVKIGQEVVAVGHPLSLDYSVSRGDCEFQGA